MASSVLADEHQRLTQTLKPCYLLIFTGLHPSDSRNNYPVSVLVRPDGTVPHLALFQNYSTLDLSSLKISEGWAETSKIPQFPLIPGFGRQFVDEFGFLVTLTVQSVLCEV